GIEDIGEDGEIEYVLGKRVERTRRPSAVAVAAQIECVDVIILAQIAGHPIPIARVITSAVDENERRLVLAAPIPELKLEAVGVEVVGDRFEVGHCLRVSRKDAQDAKCDRFDTLGTLTLLLGLLCATCAYAAAISGTITDPAGVAVSNARVLLKNA